MTYRQLAEYVARARGAYVPVVMATIEAETNFRNVLGEYQAWSARFGIGFGQVHLRWHFATLIQVARELGIALPAYTNPMHDDGANEPFRRLILGHPLLSMHLAVAVIDRAWRAAGGNWDAFTEIYVGRGISARDRERRRAIWQRWLAHYGDWAAEAHRPIEAAPPPPLPPVLAGLAPPADGWAGILALFLLVLLLAAFAGSRR